MILGGSMGRQGGIYGPGDAKAPWEMTAAGFQGASLDPKPPAGSENAKYLRGVIFAESIVFLMVPVNLSNSNVPHSSLGFWRAPWNSASAFGNGGSRIPRRQLGSEGARRMRKCQKALFP